MDRDALTREVLAALQKITVADGGDIVQAGLVQNLVVEEGERALLHSLLVCESVAVQRTCVRRDDEEAPEALPCPVGESALRERSQRFE